MKDKKYSGYCLGMQAQAQTKPRLITSGGFVLSVATDSS
jgi:hypothetical protein